MKFRKNTSYSGAGNSLFRAFCVLAEQEQHKKHIYLCPDETSAEHMERLFRSLSEKEVLPLRTLGDFLEFLQRKEGIFIASLALFSAQIPSAKEIAKLLRIVRTGEPLTREELIQYIADSGWHFSRNFAPRTYFSGGDTLTLFPSHLEGYKILFGESGIENIFSFLPEKPEEIREEKSIHLSTKTDSATWEIGNFSVRISSFFTDCHVWISGCDFQEKREEIRASLTSWNEFLDIHTDDALHLHCKNLSIPDLAALRRTLAESAGKKILFFTKNSATIRRFLQDNLFETFEVLPLCSPSQKTGEPLPFVRSLFCPFIAPKTSGKHLRGHSFSWENLTVICDDILSGVFIKTRRKKSSVSSDLLLQIHPGDFVTHLHHGVGVFEKVVQKDLSGISREYLEIRYAQDAKLFVPIDEADRLSKYVGKENPPLHRLGSAEWTRSLHQAEEEAKKAAEELLKNHAFRHILTAPVLLPLSTKEAEFRGAFPYMHTQDQVQAIGEILADLEAGRPMDRLLCGDVGFGKTEVAMNAAYRAVLNGFQVLVVSPLLILAHEHEETFQKRLSPFGVRSAALSRLIGGQEEKAILSDFAQGKIQILIGTHRILQDDIQAKNVGMVIIDEEHRLGVQEKENLAKKYAHAHILSMSATPIPRSLHLALSGIRKISTLTEAPWGRKPIETLITQESDEAIRRAIETENKRNGQSLILFNRVESMEPMRQKLGQLLGKNTRIGIAHGQMSPTQLEETIFAFKHRKTDVLLCSTVIENGVNFLDANTIIILDADRFGLSQLHQLRWRVGRAGEQGFCHLLYRRENPTPEARQRLTALASLSHLGAGYEIALRDMEIRGSGEILGLSQSGKTKEIGMGLYLRLLEQKIQELSGQGVPFSPCQMDIPLSWKIEDTFFENEGDKIHFFRSLEGLRDLAELNETWTEMCADKAPSAEAENFLLLLQARIIFSEMKIKKVSRSSGFWQMEFHADIGATDLKKLVHADRRNLLILSENRARIPEKSFPSAVEFLRYFSSSCDTRLSR